MARATYVADVTLFDGLRVRRRQGVLIEGERIVWTGSHVRAPRTTRAARAVDGTDRTLTPGLVDCHVHLNFDGGADFAAEAAEMGLALATIKATANAGKHLGAGVTTVRDLGGLGTCELAWAIDRGVVPGPRLVAAGRALDHRRARAQRGLRARSTAPMRSAGLCARRSSRGEGDQGRRDRRGADPRDRRHVHRVHARGDRRRGRRGTLVGQGCGGTRDRRGGRDGRGPGRGRLRRALRAAHEGDRRADGRTRHVPGPTLSAAFGMVEHPAEVPDYALEKIHSVLDDAERAQSLALRMKVRHVCSTDSGTRSTHTGTRRSSSRAWSHGACARSTRWSRAPRAALSCSECPTSDTCASALADLVLYDANPVDDIAALQRPRAVWKGGEVVAGRAIR